MGTKIKKYWVDGACSGNPGPGGYAVVSLEENELIYSYVENFQHTTNNRMELMAILHVMKLAAEDKENDYLVYSDSAYAINSITNYIYGWARNGWMNSKKKQVENIDLMQEIYQYVEFPMPLALQTYQLQPYHQYSLLQHLFFFLLNLQILCHL